MSHLHPFLIIKSSPERGRGVFALNAIEANTLIEDSPVIVLNKEDTKLIHRTVLHDYYFIWGEEQNQSALGLGYISIYNHSPNANCYHECNFKEGTIQIYTNTPVDAGEELFINYNKGENQLLWFDIS